MSLKVAAFHVVERHAKIRNKQGCSYLFRRKYSVFLARSFVNNYIFHYISSKNHLKMNDL